MRSASFFAFITFGISVRALPLVLRSGNTDLPASSSSNSTLSTSSLSSASPPVSLTSVMSPNTTLNFASASVTATATHASATASSAINYATYSYVSPTDTGSNPSATVYGAFNSTGTEGNATASATCLSHATASTRSASDASNSTYSAAVPTITSISFNIPDVPSACLALALGSVLPPTSTSPGTSFVSFTSLTVVSPSGSLSSNSVVSTAATNVTSTPTATAPASSTFSAPPTDVAGNTTLNKRIAQEDLPSVAQSWQDLCLVSGGDIFTNEPCVQLAGVNGINALLADADPCAQQDNADAMIDFAHSPGVTNTDALVANAVAYAGHPRNALEISRVVPSTPFCQRAPRNPELVDVVRPQLEGVNPGIFGSVTLGLFAFGAAGTCPFGHTADVSTCSCS
ncbi:hypothetical protein BC628DRAFT_1018850 [Trametes gibbosa]|nr:hypothetical protein BC628DRAFT_1018850 [Trametes gibbosa]